MRAALLAFGLLVAGCTVVPNPSYAGATDSGGQSIATGTTTSSTTGPDAEATTGTTTAPQASGGGSGSETSSGTGPDGIAPSCANPPSPPSNDSCPEICASCWNGTCEIDCTRGDACAEGVTCPDGWNCEVNCDGLFECRNVEVQCNDRYACRVRCDGASCSDATIVCGAGPCKVQCDDFSCGGLVVQCGTGNSYLECEATVGAVVEANPDSSCGCFVDPECSDNDGGTGTGTGTGGS